MHYEVEENGKVMQKHDTEFKDSLKVVKFWWKNIVNVAGGTWSILMVAANQSKPIHKTWVPYLSIHS